MNIFKKAYCRIFQKIAYIASPFLKWKMPIVFTLDNGIADLPSKINELGIAKILIVSGSTTKKLGLLDPLILNLKAQNVLFEWYDHVAPNPTFEMIYEAEQLYRDGACEAIVAFGGGSPMDCAKIVGARIAKPKQSIEKMRGLLKIRKTLPPLFAIPTTAGSGSETTLASVVTNSKTHTKFAISDPVLIPKYVALDPTLTVGLPPDLTATTGMDALTHAVEAYIGHSNIKLTRRNAEVAVKEIFQSLLTAFDNPADLKARATMQHAAFCAGIAFTRAYVGNVHAIAHAVGGMYGVPHGLANAVVLPYVLQWYGKKISRQLERLAIIIGVAQPQNNRGQNAQAFVDAIKKLNADMNIPTALPLIEKEDIPLLAQRAEKEANPFYPTPVIMSKKDLESIFEKLI